MITQDTDSTLDKYDEYRLHMEALFSASLVDFDLPTRILYSLGDAGIRRLGDLVKMSRKQLLAVRHISVVSVDYLEKFLASLDLSLKK